MCPVQLYSKVNTVQEILKYLEKKNNMQNTARTTPVDWSTKNTSGEEKNHCPCPFCIYFGIKPGMKEIILGELNLFSVYDHFIGCESETQVGWINRDRNLAGWSKISDQK